MNAGQVFNFKWTFGGQWTADHNGVPLLMWWDALDPYPDEGTTGYGRNHAVTGSAQANYPPARFFNAVTAPQGSRCTDIDCPPLPGHPHHWRDASLIDTSTGGHPAGQKVRFLINPSYRRRTCRLLFPHDAYEHHVLREWRLGDHLGDLTINTSDDQGTRVILRPYEVRIFEVLVP